MIFKISKGYLSLARQMPSEAGWWATFDLNFSIHAKSPVRVFKRCSSGNVPGLSAYYVINIPALATTLSRPQTR